MRLSKPTPNSTLGTKQLSELTPEGVLAEGVAVTQSVPALTFPAEPITAIAVAVPKTVTVTLCDHISLCEENKCNVLSKQS